MTFGEKLQKLRRESALSQEKLAEQLHVSRQAISKWELGTAAPDTDNIVRLSKFFQVPLEYLMLEDCTDPSQAIGWRAQPQTPPEVPQAPEKRPSRWAKAKLSWFVLAGILLELLSLFMSYGVQSRAWEMYGECYSDAYEYMFHLPLSLLTLLGGVVIIFGFGVVAWQKYQDIPAEKTPR
mgnify:FL=1